MFSQFIRIFTILLLISTSGAIYSDNQTATTTPILSSSSLPFGVAIELADFSLPNGLHSGAQATYNNYWLLIAGRTNGLHGFNNTDDNFPPSQQNTIVYVVDPTNGSVHSKSLFDRTSGLTQAQIDSLSVTSPQSYQYNNTLYMTGGYGVDTATGLFNTKSILSAIDVPGLIEWVISPNPSKTAAQSIRQISNPLLQVTGGYMNQVNNHATTLLIFGQNFDGYYFPNSNGNYTQQVRQFRIIDNGKSLYLLPGTSRAPDASFRRRDLNVVPVIQKNRNNYTEAFVALSGVFTLSGGAWTVPVKIDSQGFTFTVDPRQANTFKQGMNNYICPTAGIFSKKTNDMFIVLLGGISYGYFDNGTFTTDSELPFINQITTVKIDASGNFSQYLMDSEYPVIISTGPNPGNPLLFGAGGRFFSVPTLPMYPNGVFQLENLGSSPIVLGYIMGGIQSTLPNTNTSADSAASPYIFKVILQPK